MTSPYRVTLCNCGKTMPLDGETISKACEGVDSKISSDLCRSQSDVLAKIMETSDQALLIACTQEEKVFADMAEDLSVSLPQMVNIRERAGWSEEANKANPKIAALLAEAAMPYPAFPSMELSSSGRCLIYGRGDEAIAMGKALNNDLGVTVILSEPDEASIDASLIGQIVQGKITNLSGSFTKFTVTVAHYAECLPHSRDTLLFGPVSKSVETECDIVIDLVSEQPLVTGHEKRDGYFHVDPANMTAMSQVVARAREMIGSYEKPIYVAYDEDLCAHSRNQIAGCSKCLDVCPAGAISSHGNHVHIDPNICGGCGLCGAVCPSGAAQTHFPQAEHLANRMAVLVDTYLLANGKAPALLLHDEDWGGEMISMMARFGRGLPARVIPLAMHSVARSGHDTILAAFALGFEQVFILTNPQKRDEYFSIHDQVSLARQMLTGIGKFNDNQVLVIEETDPDAVADILYSSKIKSALRPAPFAPAGSPRGLTRLAMHGLAKANKTKAQVIPLTQGAPYGSLDIDTDRCTICLSCVSACPAGALQDNPDAPQLLFREDACLQCGICVATCPEHVITLKPQFNLDVSAMTNQLIIEDEPFACTSCGKVFGTKRSIENVMKKLENHSMFAEKGKLDMLQKCENCRVSSLFDQSGTISGIGQRANPRTTDDYKKS